MRHEFRRHGRFMRVLGALALSCLVGCEGPAGPKGDPGPAGGSCSVSDNGDGTFTITCDDGTSVTVQKGEQGPPGPAGEDGTSCTVTDNGDGTKTISCTDGTSVTVNDGQPGQDGLACWDLNGNGTADADEDKNGDGNYDALDCQGPPGTAGNYPQIPAEYADLNLIQLHNPNSPVYQAAEHGACVACHGDRLAEKTLDENIPTAHQAMFHVPPFSTLSGSELCERCHTYDRDGNRIAVDLINYASAGSAGRLRKQVDVRSCAMCHGPGAEHQFYQTATP